jgi:hypothetical protein
MYLLFSFEVFKTKCKDKMDKHILIELHSKLSENISKKVASTFHLKSVKNFIDYIDELDTNDQEEVGIRILECLRLIEVEQFKIMDKQDILFLFYEHIHPLGKIYEKKCDFGVKHTWVGILNVMITCIILAITRIIILDIIIALMLLWYYIPLYKKNKKGKVYGFKY